MPADGLYRSNTHTTIIGVLTLSPLESFAHAAEKIDCPAIQVNTINKIRHALGRFAKMFFGGVIGIADRSITVTIINSVLTPNIPLTTMNPFLLRQILLIR